MGEIEVEDFRLRQASLDLDCTRNLDELGADRTFPARLDQAGHLHGKRRGTGNDATVRGKLPGGATKRQHIDAGMALIAAVLIGDEHLQQGRVDVIDCGLKSPQALAGREGAQELAVSIEDFGRYLPRRVQRGRVVSVCPIECGERGGGRDGDRPDADPDAPHPTHQGAVETVIAPAAVRADSCGRYMSSTLAAGRS